ncbi:MAG: hypothetical protein R2704_17855 [Microthrixaceae bacterium]
MATHEVTNQPPPLTGYNVFAADPALVESLHREAPAVPPPTSNSRRTRGEAERRSQGRAAKREPPGC